MDINQPGPTNFLDLSDTPNTYAAQGTKATTVKSTVDGLEFTSVTTSPGGSDTQVQFNDAGSFGGDSGLTYNKTTDTLTAVSTLAVKPGNRSYTFSADDPLGALTFGRSDTTTTLTVIPSSTGANFGCSGPASPVLSFQLNTGFLNFTSANGGGAGVITFGKRLSDSSATVGAEVQFWPTTTQTTPAAAVMAPGGASYRAKLMPNGGFIFNENGDDADCRIEGDTDANLFFTDASADTVQIGATTASDSAKFYVSGKISTSGEIEINGDLNHDGSNVGFFGTTPTTKPTALTTANASAVNSGDATTDTVINNMRTRINELESKIQSLGLMT